MCDVRDFTFIMVPTTDGKTKFNIRFFEKDHMDEFTFETAQSWLEDVKKGFREGKTVGELIQEFNATWWDALMSEENSVQNHWKENGWSVDTASLEQAGRDLMRAMMAFAEGARLFNPAGEELKGWYGV